MAVNYKVEWPMSLGAARDSLEAKQPDVDNGLDVPDPSRYYSREFMALEWQKLWPRVWLLTIRALMKTSAFSFARFNRITSAICVCPS